jgi:hypothetical protein
MTARIVAEGPIITLGAGALATALAASVPVLTQTVGLGALPAAVAAEVVTVTLALIA